MSENLSQEVTLVNNILPIVIESPVCEITHQAPENLAPTIPKPAQPAAEQKPSCMPIKQLLKFARQTMKKNKLNQIGREAATGTDSLL